MSENRELAVLEAIVGGPEKRWEWLGPACDEMAAAIGSLGPGARERTVGALAAWLADDEVQWHPEAAVGLAARLGSSSLFAAAVRRARDFGLGEEDPARIPPWQAFHRMLIAATVQSPVSPGAREYIAELADQFEQATGAGKRDVTGAAWFARCQLDAGEGERARVATGLKLLRASGDKGLVVSLTGFLVAIYRAAPESRREAILGLLTDAERRRVTPTPLG